MMTWNELTARLPVLETYADEARQFARQSATWFVDWIGGSASLHHDVKSFAVEHDLEFFPTKAIIVQHLQDVFERECRKVGKR
jgi:hypothetical protein